MRWASTSSTADGDRLVRWSLRTDAIEAVARRVTSLAVTPRDPDRFDNWIADADVPVRVVTEPTPGLWSVGIETDDGKLVVTGYGAPPTGPSG